MDTTTAPRFDSPIQLYRALRHAWSAASASPPESWSADNPAKMSIGVQKGPPIGVQKGPPSSSSVTGMGVAPFALVAA